MEVFFRYVNAEDELVQNNYVRYVAFFNSGTRKIHRGDSLRIRGGIVATHFISCVATSDYFIKSSFFVALYAPARSV